MNPWLQARNILAVRLDNIGDVVMVGPALRAVKESSPLARVTLLASAAGAAGASLLPWVDDVITVRPIWQDVHARVPFHPDRDIEFAGSLAARDFDAALIFTSFSQTPHVPGYVCYLAGIPLRAGESKEFAGGTLTTELKGASDEIHQAERNLRLVEEVGFSGRDRRLSIDVGIEARAAAPHLLQKTGLDPSEPYIVLHPGASAEARRYPCDRFGHVACGLNDLGWQVLVTGTEKESALVHEVTLYAPGAHVFLGGADRRDGPSLRDYAALIESAALVVCGNTLPLHLADALGVPLIVLYSGTDREEQWRPRSTRATLLRRPTSCHPCYLFQCPIGKPCLDIPPQEVVDSARAMLESDPQRAPLVLMGAS
ncbi:MAG: glycosyltransferase family 9 protein [Chloroflexota bacterium]|nr:MAG: glycosyl transferase [Chloroflexota bacterium]